MTMERVDALAAVHRRLYKADDVRYFDVSSYALNLVQDAISSSQNKQAFLRSNMQHADLPSEDATSAGLLLKEVLLRVMDAPAKIRAVDLSCVCRLAALVITIGSEMETNIPPLDIPAISKTLIARLSIPVDATVEWGQTSSSYSAKLIIPRSE